MVNDVYDGISIKLNQEFGDDYAIYSEEVDQSFTEKCFFIDLLTSTNRQFVGERYLRNYPFDIRFFPTENNHKTAQITDVADRLIDCLKYITVDGNLVRGINMSYQIVDDVLHFMVEFNIIVSYVDNVEMMEDLETDLNVKG